METPFGLNPDFFILKTETKHELCVNEALKCFSSWAQTIFEPDMDVLDYVRKIRETYNRAVEVLHHMSGECNYFVQECIRLIPSEKVKNAIFYEYSIGCCVGIYQRLLRMQQEVYFKEDILYINNAIAIIRADNTFNEVLKAHEDLDNIIYLLKKIHLKLECKHVIKKCKIVSNVSCSELRLEHANFLESSYSKCARIGCACKCMYTSK